MQISTSTNIGVATGQLPPQLSPDWVLRLSQIRSEFFGRGGEVGARTICMKIFAKNYIQIT